MTTSARSTDSHAPSGLARCSLALAGVLAVSPASRASTFTYEIDARIRYDVTENAAVLPDTEVWGMPFAGQLSGTIDLTIDGAGNVTGSTPVDPSTGLGLLFGELVYSADRNTWCEITDGAWGTPQGRVAPLTGGTVDLLGTVLGDFTGLTIIDGFIEDGNSGDFFHMGNGVGPDGKLEFTATGPGHVTLVFRSKGMTGHGSGTYLFGVDTGSITYSNGPDLVNVDVKGVTAFYLEVDHIAQTFWTSTAQVLLEDDPALWWYLGRRIDSLGGAIDPSGGFTGTARFLGLHFISMDFVLGTGYFEDGNSAGFDASNGLVLGDTFTSVVTDDSGLFDLVIDGTLIEQSSQAGIEDVRAAPSFTLLQNFPNPFNPMTRIDFLLTEASHVRLAVYDPSGRIVVELANDLLSPRAHTYVWNGRDHAGRPVTAGVYLYRLTLDGRSENRRMVLLK